MKTLFLFVPHYVFSSDLLRTNYIRYLAIKYKVVVFSPIFKTASAQEYYQSPNIDYVAWEEQNPRFWLFFTKTLRISMIREFDNLEYFKLRRLMKINLNWQRKILRSISWFLPRKILTANFFTGLEKFLLPNSKKFIEYFNKYKPALILTCTPGFSAIEAEIIILAKKNGIKTVAINSSWDNFTSNATQLRKTDYLICWNNVMKDEAIKIHHYKENQVFISGVYRFDHHFENHPGEMSREEFLKSKGLDPQFKTLFLCTVPPNTYPTQYDVWREVIKMRAQNQFIENVNIFIRLHPNDFLEKYHEFKNTKNLHIELAGTKKQPTGSTSNKIELNKNDLDNLRYSLKYTDININFRSSLSLEATIYNKPIVNIALYGYEMHYQVDHYIPILQSGGVRLAKTNEKLCQIINNYLKNPALDETGRQEIFNKYIKFSDSLSYKRSVDFLSEMI